MIGVDVLVVDDSPMDADVTMLAVQRAAPDMKTLWIKEGDEALEFLFCVGPYKRRRRQMPRLILLDLETSAMKCLGVLDLVRSHPDTTDVPVVVLTYDMIPLTLQRGDAFDAHAYVAKPLDLEQYCLQMQRLLRQWLSPQRRAPRQRLGPTSRPERLSHHCTGTSEAALAASTNRAPAAPARYQSLRENG